MLGVRLSVSLRVQERCGKYTFQSYQIVNILKALRFLEKKKVLKINMF